ncbi:dTMP kinase [Helcococcus sueciensis]|uniref:dTMP kinase n=1 Tax=Helcococcus sueciensis TaxID=241555 RepID=UPI0004188CAD|nr:dTMP kinase [Helcococcus sueciensis]
MIGKFIAFEGSDGSGKTTILNNVEKFLIENNIDFIITREPGGTKISEEIREILLSNDNSEMSARTEALLYSASRAQHVDELILPNLQKGKLVISDRYVLSSLAYQGFGRELGYDSVKEINDFATDNLSPDYTFFFNVDPITVLKRKRNNFVTDRLENESNSYHNKVYNGYQEILKRNKDNLIIIDASKSIEEVTEQTISKLKTILNID